MQFRFLGDHTRIFGDASLEVEPGDVIDADENPDPRWFELDEFGHAPEEPTTQDEDEA